jgi:phage tail sheath gpL-like
MPVSSAVDLSAVARVVGIKTAFKDLRGGGVLFLPQRVCIFGQGNTAAVYSTDKAQITSAVQAGATYGYGSPIHLAALQLLPTNGDGVGTIPVTVYPLEDNASGVAATADITPSGAATGAASFVVKINNIESAQFVVASGDSVAAIVTKITTALAAELNLPMTATDSTTKVDLTSKWKGASANDLYIEIEATSSEDNSGITFAITQPTGGLVNPDVDDALAQIGNVWETMILNCLDIADTATLDKYATVGEGRWGALVRKPLMVFTGSTATTPAAAITVPDARKTDRTNVQLVAPGSKDLPFVVAARELARIVKVANNNPPRDYGSQKATGLNPGPDGDQWDYTQRDVAVKGGSSTIEVKDEVINLSDTVTFYHPTGDPTPAYRYVCDIVKLQNIIFNLNLIFATEEWDGAPLIPDDQPTINPTAKKPQMAVAAVNALIDSLGLNAIISDPETAKENTEAQISEQNPKRLDIALTLQLSGNTNIISVDFNFGFYFGTAAVVA